MSIITAKTKNSLTIVIDGKVFTVLNSSSNIKVIEELINEYNYIWSDKNSVKSNLLKVLSLKDSIVSFYRDRVIVTDQGAFCDGIKIHESLFKRVWDLARDGADIEMFVQFITNIYKNPNYNAIEELLLFLETNELPITEDGCFLAYRTVDIDYMSIHANPDGSRNRNFIGDVVTMDRSEVNPNRDQTCSTGLHFARFSYMADFGGHSDYNRIVIVKINPVDVVSIPSDYNNAKGRCCKYEVVGEFAKDNVDKGAFDKSFVTNVELEENYKVDGITKKKYFCKRGPDGRFVKADAE